MKNISSSRRTRLPASVLETAAEAPAGLAIRLARRAFVAAALLAALLPASAPGAADRPNLVLLMSNDHHPDLLGAIGSDVRTPHIDGLAARGAVFRNNVCQGTTCAPSRNSLLTGKYPHNTGIYRNQDGNMAPGVWMFPQALRRAGYHTALVGKNHFKPHGSTEAGERTSDEQMEQLQGLGFDYIHALNRKISAYTGKGEPGDDRYRDYLRGLGLLELFQTDYRDHRDKHFLNSHASVLPEEHHYDTYIGTEAVRFVEKYRGEEPFFMWVDFLSPHEPADAPEPYASMYEPEAMPLPRDFDRSRISGRLKEVTDDELRAFRAGYYAMITHLDAQVGRIVEALEKKGKLEDTVIVFTADQGAMLGDQGQWGKGEFYRGAVSSPMVVAGPGVKPGTVVDRPVELTDLPPSFLELAGASPKDREECHGHSLLPLLTGRGEYGRRYAFAETHDRKMVFDGRYKYLQQAEGSTLWDLEEDPRELNNVVAEHPGVEKRLKQALADWLEATPPVLPPNPRPLRPSDR